MGERKTPFITDHDIESSLQSGYYCPGCLSQIIRQSQNMMNRHLENPIHAELNEIWASPDPTRSGLEKGKKKSIQNDN